MRNWRDRPVREPAATRPAYDRIAHLYDVDMAQNMPFDDGGFYARVCRAQGGRVLELGCGNGRILLGLIGAGIDATGVDGSAGMLRQLERKAAAQAATKAFLVNAVADVGFGLGVILTISTFGTLDIQQILANAEGIRGQNINLLGWAGWAHRVGLSPVTRSQKLEVSMGSR